MHADLNYIFESGQISTVGDILTFVSKGAKINHTKEGIFTH